MFKDNLTIIDSIDSIKNQLDKILLVLVYLSSSLYSQNQ